MDLGPAECYDRASSYVPLVTSKRWLKWDSHRGVTCIRCRERTPDFDQVWSLRAEVESKSTAVGSFAALCKLREYKDTYSIANGETFSGEPRKRKSKPRARGSTRR